MVDQWALPAAVAAVAVGQGYGTFGATPAGGIVAACILLVLAFDSSRGKSRWGSAAVVGLAAVVGVAGTVASDSPPADSQHVGRWVLPTEALLQGTVLAPARIVGSRTTLWVQLDRRTDTGAPASGKIRLTLREARPFEAGSVIRFAARLRRPTNFRTPGSFDWVGYLARRGVYAVGSVRGPVDLLAHSPSWFERRIDGFRHAIREMINTAAVGPAAPVLEALVLGDDGGLARATRTAFSRAGVVHVLSVSGLHLALVAGAVAWLVRWALQRSEVLLLYSNVQAVAAVAGAAAATFYGVLAGMEVPTLRSALMLVGTTVGSILGRGSQVGHTLCLAALGILLWQPGMEFEAGFQLSFVSVAALVAYATLPPAPRGTRLWVVMQALWSSVVASVATAPLTAFHFHQVSLIGPLVNVLVIPLFGVVVLAPALCGALLVTVSRTGALFFFQAAAAVVGPATALVDAVGAWRWAALEVPMPTAAEVVVVYCVMLAGRVRPRAAPAAVVLAALVFVVAERPWPMVARARPLRVTFLDVGQGDAAVVEMPDGRVALVDGGGFPGSDFDVGEAVLLPYLAVRRIGRIDLVVVSHQHPDHFAGLPAVFGHRVVGQWWWNGATGGAPWPELERAARGVPRRRPRPGEAQALWPEVTVLHPPAEWQSPANDASVVLRLDYGAAGIVFAGDAERAAEHAMVGAGERLEAAVLKVPHHGSATSSTAEFLDRVTPRIAVISAGPDNRYGLPAPAVEARYAARGVCVLRTDRCGAITVETDGREVTATAEVADCACPRVALRPPR
jgi:competence protein ComEC